MRSALFLSFFVTAESASCTVENATDYSGHDLSGGKHSVFSFGECCDLCSESWADGCRVWTFQPPRTCLLKFSDNGRRVPGKDVPAEVANYVSGFAEPASASCRDDWDCALAGTCNNKTGVCQCDPWATGADCSRLNLLPVDRKALGYLHPEHSSWGGNAVQSSDGKWHMYMAEIACTPGSNRTRCGLGGWETNSQVAHAVSDAPEGPYVRRDLLLAREHHNPTIKVNPKDKSWHVYSIDVHWGPIVVSSSYDEGKTWTNTTPGLEVSRYQNPGPVIRPDGEVSMFYRSGAGAGKSEPACSHESIGVQYCADPRTPCAGPGLTTTMFGHTAEDPSVFIDHRGNWHMLVNALPGSCHPKANQGGHAWSRDGVTWSEPRVNAYNATVHFTDGSTLNCERRERPQMILDSSGNPVALTTGLTGCPAGSLNETAFRAGGDCFTLAQKLNTEATQIIV